MPVVHVHWQTCTLIIRGYCASVSERNVTFLNTTVSQHFCLTVASRPVAPQCVIRKNRDMNVKWHKLNKILLFCACVYVCTRACLHSVISFPNKSAPVFRVKHLKKWKRIHLGVSGEKKKKKKRKKERWCNVIRRDGCESTLAEIMSIWPPIILTCICLLGNNGLLWSHATLFCSCLPGKRTKWEHREKSEYSSLSAWRLVFCFFFTKETMRTWDWSLSCFAQQTDSHSQSSACLFLSDTFFCFCVVVVFFYKINSPPPPESFCHLHTNAQNTPLR